MTNYNTSDKIRTLRGYRGLSDFKALEHGMGDELMKGSQDDIFENELLRQAERKQGLLKVLKRPNGTKDFYLFFKSPFTKIWGVWGSLVIYLVGLLLIDNIYLQGHYNVINGVAQGGGLLDSIAYLLLIGLFLFSMLQQLLYRVFFFVARKKGYFRGIIIHVFFAFASLRMMYLYSDVVYPWDYSFVFDVSELGELMIYNDFTFGLSLIGASLNVFVWLAVYVYWKLIGAHSIVGLMGAIYARGKLIKKGRWNSLMENSYNNRFILGGLHSFMMWTLILPTTLWWSGWVDFWWYGRVI